MRITAKIDTWLKKFVKDSGLLPKDEKVFVLKGHGYNVDKLLVLGVINLRVLKMY